MMTENCDKYVKKALIGFVLFSTIILLILLKKIQFLEAFNHLNSYFILYIIIVFIISMKLLMPYITCLSKYTKKK